MNQCDIPIVGDLMKLVYDDVIDPNLKDMILLILIFPFIHEGLKQTSYLIEELFDSSLKTINEYLYIFYASWKQSFL